MTHLKSNIKTKTSIKCCKNVNFPILHNFKKILGQVWVSFGNFEIPILVNYCQVFLKPFLCKFKY